MESVGVSALAGEEVEALFRRSQRLLWGLAYRMLGSAADADELLQEAFLRLLERPPADTGAPLQPWLVRVTMNLARDRLRRRKVRGYEGEWLPGPVDSERLLDLGPEGPPAERPDVRYERLESASFAFLIALEALTSRQRAVLLLRDVLGYDVRETAAALGLSRDNVKTTHLRARRAMESFERARRPLDEAARAAHQDALGRFALALESGDAPALLALLAPGVVARSDGGGEFHAARLPVQGPARVAAFFLGLGRKRPEGTRFSLREVNGLPALLVEIPPMGPGVAPRTLLRLELDAAGKVSQVHAILATRKLAGLGPASA